MLKNRLNGTASNVKLTKQKTILFLKQTNIRIFLRGGKQQKSESMSRIDNLLINEISNIGVIYQAKTKLKSLRSWFLKDSRIQSEISFTQIYLVDIEDL